MSKARLISKFIVTSSNVVGLTTSNVSEAANLYFSNSRVVNALTEGTGINIDSNGLVTVTVTGGSGSGNVDSVNGQVGVVQLSTSDIPEGSNTYFTNQRAINAIIDGNVGLSSLHDDIGVVTTNFLTTANVPEVNNLYFTNQRALNAINQSNITLSDLTLLGNLYLVGNSFTVSENVLVIGDPLIQIGYGNPSDSLDLGFVGHYNENGSEKVFGIVRDSTDKFIKIFDNYSNSLIVTNNIDTTNVSFRLASIVASNYYGNILWSNIVNKPNTDLIPEGFDNRYFTEERARDALSSTVVSFFNNDVGYAVTASLTTANVIEVGNLYYSNARVYGNVSQLNFATNSQLGIYATNNQLSIYATNTQ